MKKKPAKSTKQSTQSQSKDAVLLGGLYVLTFLVFQVVNFISASVKAVDWDKTIDIAELQSKGVIQFVAFLAAYFITLIYIKNRSK